MKRQNTKSFNNMECTCICMCSILTAFQNITTCTFGSKIIVYSLLCRSVLFLLAQLSKTKKCSVSFCDRSMSGVRRPSSVRPCVRAPMRQSTISLNNISSEIAYWILTKLHRNDPWVVPYQSCSN